MNVGDFSRVNTTLTVHEGELLTDNQLLQLLQAKDVDAMVLLLQSTPYHFDTQSIEDPDAIEKELMRSLLSAYRFAIEEAPIKEIAYLFYLKYVYHNLKVLLKMKANDIDLSHLLILTSQKEKEALDHLVTTLESDEFDPILVEGVREAWEDYQTYQNVQAIEVDLDTTYFKHLDQFKSVIQMPEIDQLIDIMQDFYNVITVQRAQLIGESQSFMLKMMNEQGTQKNRALITMVEQNELASWFDSINPQVYSQAFNWALTKMKDGTIQSVDLELLRDQLIHAIVEQGQYDGTSPLALLRYLHGKEMEVINLRLILTGRANRLSEEQIMERMRPVYGK